MEINEIIKPENLVYGKPRLMNENPMHYCPGCSHGVIHKLIAEVTDMRLMGHVECQRLMHPSHKATYNELRGWLEQTAAGAGPAAD